MVSAALGASTPALAVEEFDGLAASTPDGIWFASAESDFVTTVSVSRKDNHATEASFRPKANPNPRGLFLSLEFLELHAVVFEDPLVRRKFAPDSPLEEAGFELVWGFSCQGVVFGLLQFFVRSGKGRSSFFNRAPGVKKVIHFGLRKTVSSARWACHWRNAVSSFRLRAVSPSRPVDRPAKKDTSAALGQACPGSEQEGPARVAQCPHERRSGARGRYLFAHRGKPGWHSVAVFEHATSSRGHGSFRGLLEMSEPQRGVGEAGTAMSRARSTP
jgi:hypothetical protein